MTTKVLIVNFGNKPIHVEKIGRDAQGKFTDGGEKVEVGVQQSHEAWVYDTQDIHISEKKD